MRGMVCRLVGLWVLSAALLSAGETLKSKKDIPYGKDSRQKIDIYWTPSKTPRPVMIFVHGGAWRIGDRAHVQNKPQAFVDQGFVFASVGYRLSSSMTYREQASDVARGIALVQRSVSKVGGDPQRIFLMGHSAGAHLAALVATDERYLKAEKQDLSLLKGVVLLDGAGYDIPRQIATTPRERGKQLYRRVFGEDEATQRDASPITHVESGKGIPPFLLLYVAHRLDSRAQSQGLARKLRAAGIEARVVGCRGETHATINRQFGEEDHLATTEAFQFLKKRLAQLSQESTAKTSEGR